MDNPNPNTIKERKVIPATAAVFPLYVLTLAVGAMLAGTGDADAMDCSRAPTSAERTICGDKKLLLLDHDLTIVYHKFIKVFSDTGHYTHLVAETRTGQKEWLWRTATMLAYRQRAFPTIGGLRIGQRFTAIAYGSLGAGISRRRKSRRSQRCCSCMLARVLRRWSITPSQAANTAAASG